MSKRYSIVQIQVLCILFQSNTFILRTLFVTLSNVWTYSPVVLRDIKLAQAWRQYIKMLKAVDLLNNRLN